MTGTPFTPTELKHMGKKAGCAALALRYPQHSARWYSRNWHKVLALPDLEMIERPDATFIRRTRTLDPTGEKAVRNVVRLAHAENVVDPSATMTPSLRRQAAISRMEQEGLNRDRATAALVARVREVEQAVTAA